MKNQSDTIVNFATFDIEEWYAANYNSLNLNNLPQHPGHLQKNVGRLLEICEKFNIKATHFVVGDIALNKPEIVKMIHQAGHEVASHSYAHKLIFTMTPEQFREDLRQSCDLIEQITGEKVAGFRAPSWSVKKDMLSWFYQILHEQGISYSSSVFPGKTFLYGIPGFPENIHQPVIDGVKQQVWEIPQTLFSFLGKKTGFSGGFYLRALPGWFITRMIKAKNNEGKSVFLYLHPREIDADSPRLSLPMLERFIHYHGVRGCENKFSYLAGIFKDTFCKMGDFIKSLN
ncbi:MAG TPA: polysaccharide deacetylase family protein [Bacteroidales bacterium]|nr:polysaccharide deacetylase family protein [Bacteroidales bacterium]